MEKAKDDHRVSVEVFDQHAKSYSDTIDSSLQKFGASHDFFTRHKARLIARLLADAGRDMAAIDLLDVGCGIGIIHPLIGPQFRSLHGVDVSQSSIDEAKARFPQYRYDAYDGDTLPCADGSLDMTLAICVFHHVPPALWQQLANEMMRVLRPGGLALVIEHNPWNPVTRRIVNSCPIDADAVLLTRPKTLALFKAAGAVRVTARSILSIPPKTDFLMTVDSWLGVLPLGAQYYWLAEKGRGKG